FWESLRAEPALAGCARGMLGQAFWTNAEIETLTARGECDLAASASNATSELAPSVGPRTQALAASIAEHMLTELPEPIFSMVIHSEVSQHVTRMVFEPTRLRGSWEIRALI